VTLPSALVNANGTLALTAELDIAGTWTDATSLVYQRDGSSPAVSGTRGRPDESSDQATPASGTCELNNRAGQFSPKNAMGQYYGSFGRNTALRMSVPAQYARMRTEADGSSGASCPSASSMAVVTELDVQVDCDLSTWRGTLAYKGGNAWLVSLSSTGIALEWWDSGGAVHSVTSGLLPPGRPGRCVLRVQLLVSTGTVTFWYGAAGTIGTGPWTQLGPAAVTGATSVATTTGSVVVGTANGDYYQFQLTTGSGTVSAGPNWTAQSPGTATFVDGEGNTWSYVGTADCDNRSYRAHGECSALPAKWDKSGIDISVPVTFSGILRRLSQGDSPTQSSMQRGVVSQAGTLFPNAYWTCEDAAGASAFGSAIGGPSMTFTGGARAPSLAADSSFACSAPLPTLGSSGWAGPVPAYSGAGSIVVRFLLKLGSSLGTPPATGWPLVRVSTSGTATNLDLDVYSGYGIGIAGGNASGNVFTSGSQAFGADMPSGTMQGTTVWCSLELRPSGGNVDWAIAMMYPGSSQAYAVSGSYAGTVGVAQAVHVHAGALTDTVVGHVSVQSDWTSLFSLAGPLEAWQGEEAADRVIRVCGENSIAARVSAGPSAPMGPQPVDTVLNILQECEDADRGLLYDSRRALAIGYRTYASMCQQPPKVTIDYSQAELGGGESDLEPTLDDQLTRNDWTITRGSSGDSSTQGLTFQYQLDDGSSMSIGEIGDYSDSDTINVETDTMVPDVTRWMVHIGTVDEARWPLIPFNLARPQLAALFWALMDMDVGDCMELVNLESTTVTYDPVKQLAYGIKESLGGLHYELEVNGVPESPYEVILLDDPVYGRCDTDGSTLHSSINTTSLTMDVDTGAGYPLWTTSSGDFPFDVAVDGERMTVSGIANTSGTQLFTLSARAVNGVSKVHHAGADVRLWFPPILALR
jgi:hypothetical protein